MAERSYGAQRLPWAFCGANSVPAGTHHPGGKPSGGDATSDRSQGPASGSPRLATGRVRDCGVRAPKHHPSTVWLSAFQRPKP